MAKQARAKQGRAKKGSAGEGRGRAIWCERGRGEEEGGGEGDVGEVVWVSRLGGGRECECAMWGWERLLV